jgi:hypothetical protein
MVTQFTSTTLRNEAQKQGISEIIDKGDVYEYLVRTMADIAAKSNKAGRTDENGGDTSADSTNDSPAGVARAARLC